MGEELLIRVVSLVLTTIESGIYIDKDSAYHCPLTLHLLVLYYALIIVSNMLNISCSWAEKKLMFKDCIFAVFYLKLFFLTVILYVVH